MGSSSSRADALRRIAALLQERRHIRVPPDPEEREVAFIRSSAARCVGFATLQNEGRFGLVAKQLPFRFQLCNLPNAAPRGLADDGRGGLVCRWHGLERLV